MDFDHLNYSSEATDELSLQDEIDRLSGSVRTDLTELRREILAHISEIRVDIFHQWSRLNLRQRDGSIIWGVEDNTLLEVLEDHIFGPNNKLFLHVRLPDGREWYVSADYVKTASRRPIPRPNTSVPPRSSEPRPVEPPRPTPPPPIWPARPDPSPRWTEVEEGETLGEIPYSNTAVWRDGIPYLIQPDGTEVPMEIQELPSLDSLYPWLIEYITIWSEAAQQKIAEMTARWATSDDELINTSIAEVDERFRELSESIFSYPRDEANERRIIQEMFAAINRAEWNGNWIEGETILTNNEEIEAILLDPNISPEEKRLAVMRLSRERLTYMWLWTEFGNSSRVRSMLADQLLATGDFAWINNLLEDPELISLAQWGIRNTDALTQKIQAAGINEDNGFTRHDARSIAEHLITQAGEISERLNSQENREYFQTLLAEVNPQRVAAGEEELSLNDLIEHQENIALIEYAKHLLLRTHIMQMEHRGDQDTSLTGMYADISWLAENRWGLRDLFDYADSSIDWIIEWSTFVVTTIVTMGAWALAVAGVNASRAALIARSTHLARFANSTSRGVQALRIAAGVSTEGFMFYQGMNLANNLLHQDELREWNDFFEGAWNMEWIVHSVIGLGVFRFFNYLRAGGHIPGTRIVPNERVPAGLLRQTWYIVWEAGSITLATEWANALIFDEGWSPTFAEFFQALVMVGALRGMEAWIPAMRSNYRARRNQNGDIEVQVLNTPPSEFIPTHTRNGRQYMVDQRWNIWFRQDSGDIVASRANLDRLSAIVPSRPTRSAEAWTVHEHISDDIWRAFQNESSTQPFRNHPQFSSILDDIVVRISRNEQITPRQESIRQAFSGEINTWLQALASRWSTETSPRPTETASRPAEAPVSIRIPLRERILWARGQASTQEWFDTITWNILRRMQNWDNIQLWELRITQRGTTRRPEYIIETQWNSTTQTFTSLNAVREHIRTSITQPQQRLQTLIQYFDWSTNANLQRLHGRVLDVNWNRVRIQTNNGRLEFSRNTWRDSWENISIANLWDDVVEGIFQQLSGINLRQTVSSAISASETRVVNGETYVNLRSFLSNIRSQWQRTSTFLWDLPLWVWRLYRWGEYVSLGVIHDIMTPARILQGIVRMNGTMIRNEVNFRSVVIGGVGITALDAFLFAYLSNEEDGGMIDLTIWHILHEGVSWIAYNAIAYPTLWVINTLAFEAIVMDEE